MSLAIGEVCKLFSARPLRPKYLPYAFEVHGADLDYNPLLLILEDTVSLSSGHAADVEELRTVDHVVV